MILSLKNYKKIFITVMALIIAFGICVVPAKAASVNTGEHSSSGTYNLYVRKMGSTDILVYMKLSKDIIAVYNTFTAAQNCGSVTVYVSNTNANSSYKSNSVVSLPQNASVIAKKSVSNPSIIYGKCSVSY